MVKNGGNRNHQGTAATRRVWDELVMGVIDWREREKLESLQVRINQHWKVNYMSLADYIYEGGNHEGPCLIVYFYLEYTLNKTKVQHAQQMRLCK